MNKFVQIVTGSVLVLLLCLSLLGCGSENVSHPDIKGDWLLFKDQGNVVASQNQFVLQVSEHAMELRNVKTGLSVWEGPRPYSWSGSTLILEPSGDLPEERAVVLSAQKERIEIADFNKWSRSLFKKADQNTWNQAMASAQKLSTADRLIEVIEERLKGVWEKSAALPPYSGIGMIVEIGRGQIRGQTYSLAGVSNLLGKEVPCQYTLKDVSEATIYCPNNGKTYPMKITIQSPDEMEVVFGSYTIPLVRSHPRQFQALAQKYRSRFLRLDEKEGLRQTESLGQ